MRCALFAVAAAVAGCSSWFGKSPPPPKQFAKSPPQPTPPPLTANSSTFDIGNGVVLRVGREAGGACTTAAVANGNELWSERTCLGTKEHPWFFSPDKEWLLVIERAPAVDGRGPSVVHVARLFRRGIPQRALTLADLSVVETAVQIEEGRLRWLAEDPKAAEEGVELRLADWTVARFRWPAVAAPGQAAPSPAPALACQPCSYVDEQGVYHLAATDEDIPAKYRTRARAIQGQVTTYTETPRPVASPPEPSRRRLSDGYSQEELNKQTAEEQRKLDARAAQLAEERERNRGVPTLPAGSLMARCFDNSMRPRRCDDGEIREAERRARGARW
jgi:hypothetical protein